MYPSIIFLETDAVFSGAKTPPPEIFASSLYASLWARFPKASRTLTTIVVFSHRINTSEEATAFIETGGAGRTVIRVNPRIPLLSVNSKRYTQEVFRKLFRKTYSLVDMFIGS